MSSQQQAWVDLTLILNDWRDRHELSDTEMLTALETWIASQHIVMGAIASLPKEGA